MPKILCFFVFFQKALIQVKGKVSLGLGRTKQRQNSHSQALSNVFFAVCFLPTTTSPSPDKGNQAVARSVEDLACIFIC